MRHLPFYLSALALTGACQPDYTPPETGTELGGLGGTPTDMGDIVFRACRSDAFFVDVPTFADPGWAAGATSPSGWRAQVASALAVRANQARREWFGDRCAGEVRVVHYGVLSSRTVSGLPERTSGRDRFNRFRFECVSDARGDEEARPRPLAVEDAYLCEVVEALRMDVASRTPALLTRNEVFVGRECDASPAGLESDPSTPMKSWHFPALGMSGPSTPNLRREAVAQLAILDAGLEPAMAAAVGSVGGGDFAAAYATPGIHRHGAAMAAYARQIAPDVRLLTPRVMDALGLASSEAIARALDAVLFDQSSARLPLVFDLSLGWNPNLSQRAGISGRRSGGGVCLSYEDPHGEAVRYMLALARRLDDTDQRRITVFAANGNQSGDPSAGPNVGASTDPYPAYAGVAPPSTPPSPLPATCHPTAPGSVFYPGAYEGSTTCLAGFGIVNDTAHRVSAIAADYDPAVNGIPGAEAALVAIGQHVIADDPAGAGAVACTPSFPPAPRLPASLTGSSVSAVFAAAAAARVQQTLLSTRRAPLDWDGMKAFLSWNARSLCRTNGNGQGVRRLDVGRLDDALGRCGLLTACAAGTVSNPWYCWYARQWCWGSSFIQCDSPKSAPPVPSVGTAVCGATSISFASAAVAMTTCAGPDCTLEAAYDKYHVGGAGPQPEGNGCPFCLFNLSGPLEPQSRFDAVFELNPDFPPGTTFSNPQLQLTLKTVNGVETRWVNLVGSDFTQPTDWTPGETLFVEGDVELNLLAPVDSMKAELHMVVANPYGGGQPVVDVSPLVGELLP